MTLLPFVLWLLLWPLVCVTVELLAVQRDRLAGRRISKPDEIQSAMGAGEFTFYIIVAAVILFCK